MNWPDSTCLDSLTDHQRQEITLTCGGSVCLLAGRPGTGKTFAVAAMIRLLKGCRLAVAAPTGKAAVRVTESLCNAGVKGITATTIHSLLKVESVDLGAWRFAHNEDNPLPLDFIFVDESSMIHTGLMASLLAARRPGCRLMFVGDPGQLSPVEHGAPFRDLIAAGLPCGKLTEIMRNSGRIVKACHAIADRGVYEPSLKLDLAAGENLLHIERGRPESQIATLTDLLGKIRAKGEHDVVRDVQILVPVNDKSKLGRKPLNKMLQNLLNGEGLGAKGNPFRVGDKIICGRNGLVPLEGKKGKQEKVYVANGEQGIVKKVTSTYTIATLQAPDRRVLIPRGQNGDDDAGCDWDLAYAISVHRSQGSEWPVVIVMADSYPGAVMLMKKEFWYTAISRGKHICVTIGQKSVIDGACRKSGIWERKTFLVDVLNALRNQALISEWDNLLANAGV